MRNRQLLVLAILILFSLAAAADSTVKTRNTAMGHSSESTVYIKGARQRTEGASMGQGPSFVTIMQCDQKRMITVNPQNNTCMVVPMGGDGGAEAAPAAAAGASRKGGTTTFTVDTLDTGERQKMFGLTARHMKSTMNAESSSDACSKTNLHTETDGWYADIAPGLACWTGMTPPPSRSAGRAGCQDTMRFKHTGAGHPGYPLKQTTTMQVQGQSFTTTSEVVALTSSPLEAALFEMPAGCQIVSSYQELMGMGGATGGGPPRGRPPAPAPEAAAPPPAPEPAAPAPEPAAPAAPAAPPVAAKTAGVVRVGVVKINDATGENLPLDNLRVNLMSEVTLRQMEAVPLDADGHPAIAAEAAQKECDYILYTDASQVKDPGAGGVALPAGLRGVSLAKDKYQALLAITLYRAGKPLPELKQAPLAADADQFGVNAVMAAFEKEADKVAEQVKKDTSRPARPTAPAKKPAAPKKPG